MPIEFGPAFWSVIAAVTIGGIVRGFSGFGTAMIVVPVTALAYDPQTAVVLIVIIDSLPILPLVVAAARKVEPGRLAPLIAGYALTLPLGLWFLAEGDTVVLRWFISLVIVVAVAVLWSGWAYRGPRNVPVRLGVGGLSGFLGGAAQLTGPPVIVYLMALRTGAGQVRANLIIYFACTEVLAIIGLAVAGLFTVRAVVLGLLCSPVYLVALLAGARLFGFSSEMTYRRIALTIVLAASILSLPALDGLRG